MNLSLPKRQCWPCAVSFVPKGSGRARRNPDHYMGTTPGRCGLTGYRSCTGIAEDRGNKATSSPAELPECARNQPIVLMVGGAGGGTTIRLRANHRTTILRSLSRITLTAQFLQACSDRREIV